MSTFGIRLKEERERLQLSQTAFGELGGVKKQAQLKYEKDARSPDATYHSAIALAGVDVAYVLTGAKTQNSATTPREVALLDNFRHSTVDVQLGVSKLLAETGHAIDRSNKEMYQSIEKGLAHGVHSDAVHNAAKENE